MGIIEDKIEDWVLSIALKKGLKSLIKLGISFLTSIAVVTFLNKMGINFHLDQNAFELGLTALVNSGFEILRNYIKHNYDVKHI